jgi:methanogenic corrinoid protein MtbC1
MRSYQEQGLSAAEAARLAAAEVHEQVPAVAVTAAPDGSDLARALERFDEPGAQQEFDRAASALSLDALLRDLVIPYLADLGDRWEAGSVSVAQEHFASNFLRGRLLALARGWGQGSGPLAVLACAPGELHDLALISFGLALHGRGWQIAYLGPDTPSTTLLETARTLEPDLVVVSATTPQLLSRARDELKALTEVAPLALAGAGSKPAFADSVGATLLGDDPVTEAERVSSSRAARSSRRKRHENV